MRIQTWTTLVDTDGYSSSAEYQRVEQEIRSAVEKVVHPADSDRFTIFPESGKARGQGNGVVPIKKSFAANISALGWELEKKAPPSVHNASSAGKGSRPGAFDAHKAFETDLPPFVVEWETGNISSSHRAINRIGLGLVHRYISGGVLILPTEKLAKYLTDRIGNTPELLPYHPLWQLWSSMSLSYLAIVGIEHDNESTNVPRIPKGTDGRAVS